MEPIELRDLDEARRYVVESLWLQRAVKPTPATVRPTLEWAMELASAGHLVPPLGFIADVGHIALGEDVARQGKDELHIPAWPPVLGRTYEDHVLGKLYADWNFERACDALRRYTLKERNRGVAYIVRQIRERAVAQSGMPRTAVGFLGVLLPPAVIRTLLSSNPVDVLSSAWDVLLRDGPTQLMKGIYEQMAAVGRRMTEVLGPEDAIALEQKMALADMGPYVAHRQILQSTAYIESLLPARPVRPHIGRKEVPTRILDEDQYPVGGYTAIATRGSIESLLHSQLAYIEDDAGSEPDLFDVKFARDELFYYSRDENQFLRRRRAFVFVLYPDLIAARFKDPELPHQRIVVIQSAILAIIRRLSDWLRTDAIRFEVLFVKDGDKQPLHEEAELTRLLLRDTIERGDGLVESVSDRISVVKRLNTLARQAQVHCLAVATEPFEMELDTAIVTELIVAGPRPEIGEGDGVVAPLEGEEPIDVWQETVLRVLQLWV